MASDKLAKARARFAAAKVRAKGMLGNTKPFLMAGGGGAAGFYAQQWAGENFDFVRNKYWGGPALLLGAGMFAGKRGYQAAGHGLAGAAGYALAFNYELSKFQNGKRQSSPVGAFADPAPGAPAASTKGPDGYGDPFGGDASGYLDGADDVQAPVQFTEAAGMYDDTGADDDADVSSAVNLGGGVGNEWEV
jgi:hypothetical protein